MEEKIPKVHIGQVDQPDNKRLQAVPDPDPDPDDEQVPQTEELTVEILGFDPAQEEDKFARMAARIQLKGLEIRQASWDGPDRVQKSSSLFDRLTAVFEELRDIQKAMERN